MTEDDGKRHLSRFKFIGDGHPARNIFHMGVATCLQGGGIVAKDLEHPEDRPLARDALAHLAMATLEDFNTLHRIGPHVGFRIGAGRDMAQHHDAIPGMQHVG